MVSVSPTTMWRPAALLLLSAPAALGWYNGTPAGVPT